MNECNSQQNVYQSSGFLLNTGSSSFGTPVKTPKSTLLTSELNSEPLSLTRSFSYHNLNESPAKTSSKSKTISSLFGISLLILLGSSKSVVSSIIVLNFSDK